MKILGIDYGLKYVGVAVSDNNETVAFPLIVLRNDKKLFFNLEKIINREDIGLIVVGESLDFNLEDNYINSKIKIFIKEIKNRWELPVFLINEVFSSMEVKWGLEKSIRREKTRKNKKHQRIDDKAAASILRSFLDNKDKV